MIQTGIFQRNSKEKTAYKSDLIFFLSYHVWYWSVLAPLSQKPQELGQICLKDPDMKLHLEFKGEKYYKIRLEIKILNFVYLGNDKSYKQSVIHVAC